MAEKEGVAQVCREASECSTGTKATAHKARQRRTLRFEPEFEPKGLIVERLPSFCSTPQSTFRVRITILWGWGGAIVFPLYYDPSSEHSNNKIIRTSGHNPSKDGPKSASRAPNQLRINASGGVVKMTTFVAGGLVIC